ncbi:phage tail sheath subtilisin-like domain-containing protein [Haliangium ochraceum]|uniref:Tail sheath protein subtilisin-like domain-containing protein n=1 Tax=Haliangium ochraceum (strain DSM 14365 / JCM 11303 / SMP-2) TaxID=502025 RepID=D0LVV1_HALO1|nr:phage tail sheath subtilisin-like domain-containing protein [Haliangium ochraceum]ACY14085.1 hypothetical protein Hoch_1533 [Haliangium ochraceum DSM 14365]
MALIIPGVQVNVVKEVVPPPANPSGIVGIIGITDQGPAKGARAGTWKEFVDLFGAASAYSLPEARPVFENGAFEAVIVPASTSAQRAQLAFQDSAGDVVFRLYARAAGTWANGALSAEVTNARSADQPAEALFDLVLRYKGDEEVFRNLQVADPAAPGYLFSVINGNSTLAAAIPAPENLGTAPATGLEIAFDSEGQRQSLVAGINLVWRSSTAGKVVVAREDGQTTFDLQIYSGDQLVDQVAEIVLDADAEPDGTQALVAALADHPVLGAELVLPSNSLPPLVRSAVFSEGTEPSVAAYLDALEELTKESDVDLVLASVHGPYSSVYDQIYSAVRDHCAAMSRDAKNRIGLGAAPAGLPLEELTTLAQKLNSDRFVLTAPAGLAGAVAGRIAQLAYFQSPTYKKVGGVSSLETDYLPSQLNTLLKAHVLPVDFDRQLGFIIIHGIATSGEQISVTRVQDYAVRGVKAISDLFIGRLNNELARLALRQKLTEFLLQMEKDGAIVPSTDGTDPAFKVNVYSSQADFAQGIVRVDIAIRPVRAIDYVYATILVQV